MTNTIEIENLNISDLDIPTDETLQEVATACENIATSSEGIATSCDNIATSCGDLAKDTTLQDTNTALGSLATDATLQATNTALGSILGSLSGFATDNTLQDVKGSIDDLVTAEGTILNTTLGAVAKDATLQSTNTALGSIIKDTTGQSIDASVGSIATVLSDVATDTTLAGVAKDTTLQATNTALGSLMADTTGQSIASAISGLGQTLGSDKANISGDNIANKLLFRENIGLGVETLTLTPTVASGVTSRGFTAYKSGSLVIVNAYFDLTRSFANNERIVTFNEFLPAMVGSYAVSAIHSVATQEGFISIGVNETNNIKAWGTIPSGSYYYGQLMYFTRS